MGLEHTAHILTSLLLVYKGAEMIGGEHRSARATAELTCLGMLSTALRYEGLFLVGTLALLLIIRRRYWPAFSLLLGGVLPVCVMGIINVSQGWNLLPNSVLLKGARIDPVNGIALLDELGEETVA